MSIELIVLPFLVIALQSTTSIQQIDADKIVAPASLSVTEADSTEKVYDPDLSKEADVKTQVYKQLSTESGLGAEPTQLTAGPLTGSVNQLSKRDRNMESAPALSERKLGFETAMVRLKGTDRCSAELISADDRDFCSSVIENRSAEYAGPEPAKLSPEQKLLGERDFNLVNAGPGGAAKRLATRQNSAEDRDDQAIASLVLSRPATDNEQPDKSENASDAGSETQALIEAIIKNVTQPR